MRRDRSPQSLEQQREDARRRAEERDQRAREAAALRNRQFVGSEVVRSHYNARPSQNREERHHSPIVNLRNFNNWVKACLIRQFTSSDAREAVLDLGCGKGGDLQKWDKAEIGEYIGIDLAEKSIEQARERFARMRNVRFRAQFYVFDCFGKSIGDVLPPAHRRGATFDLVTMQFCLHYAFETEAKARRMLQNVAEALPRGGKFIGTIPSSDVIVKHLARLSKDGAASGGGGGATASAGALKAGDDAGESTGPSWGNSIYKVTFDKPAPVDLHSGEVVFRPPFGHRYTFYLKDAVDIVPEFVVPFEALRALAEEYNLELVYRKSFAEVFDEKKDDFDAGILLDRLGVVDKRGERGIEGDEKECADFYLAFCFEKRGRG